MTATSSADPKATVRTTCPSCHQPGRRVTTTTLAALLKEEYATEFATGGLDECSAEGGCCRSVTDDTGWRFCPTPDCDTVYFSERGEGLFTKSQLKVSVGVKEKSGERPLCYCFGHSIASIKEELRTEGRSDALEDIRAKMKDPGCHCETSNPSGSCCLGSVARGIEIAKKELGQVGSPPAGINPTDSASATTGKAKNRGSRAGWIATAGTLISAILASACCWLPLVLLALGVSGVGIAATLEAYRPLLIIVTFGLLAAAFYFTYRPGKTSADGTPDCCADESNQAENCCSPAAARGRLSVMTLNKAMLWVVTALAVAFLFFPSYVGYLVRSGNQQGLVGEDVAQTVVDVEGMTCEGCAAALGESLRGIPGVTGVTVDFEAGKAIIQHSACCPIPEEDIKSAVTKAGFEITPITETTSPSASDERP